jgi:hypothetical protein
MGNGYLEFWKVIEPALGNSLRRGFVLDNRETPKIETQQARRRLQELYQREQQQTGLIEEFLAAQGSDAQEVVRERFIAQGILPDEIQKAVQAARSHREIQRADQRAQQLRTLVGKYKCRFGIHSLDDWSYLEDGICITQGGCQRCKAEIDTLAHDYFQVTGYNYDTGQALGFKTDKCRRCGEGAREGYWDIIRGASMTGV